MKTLHTGLVLAAWLATTVRGQTPIGGLSGSHTNIPRWCGKPYMAGSPNFNPGGQTEPPKPSTSELLDLRVVPHYSIYDSSEHAAQFIVAADLSHTYGEPFSHGQGANNATKFDVDIRVQGAATPLATGLVPIGGKHLIDFQLSTLHARLESYPIVLTAKPANDSAGRSYSAQTELYYLPAKNSGSTVKIDNLHKGLLVANNVTHYSFEPLLPVGFYTSCSGYLNYSLANVSAYKDMGFNAINPVCAFTDGPLDYLFDWMDQVNLWYQYDMRGSYLNLTSVAQQIPLVKDRSSLLSYYTADEPDGWQYNLTSTRRAYDLLKQQDPYHPVSLVLNCDDYYFEQYSSGADYIMEDAYPVGINPTYSIPWNTTCNSTYGDCGCDDCIGALTDVSDRLDTLFEYQQWLNEWQKPLWAVLQAFNGEGYWSRSPTFQETWVMMILSFNHRATGLMSWIFPTTPQDLSDAHADMAKVVTVSPVKDFLLNGHPTKIKITGHRQLDVSYWTSEKQALVALANVESTAVNGTVSVDLPRKAQSIASQPWGSTSWHVDGGVLSAPSIEGLATSIVLLDL